MISFIIPAHNEEAWVGRCVSAIRSGLESLDEPHEIIVVDDASSDATASIARQQDAQVVRVEHRQIAATRNPERFAQEAPGHNSKAVHRAYAHKAKVELPSLGEYERQRAKFIGSPIEAIDDGCRFVKNER